MRAKSISPPVTRPGPSWRRLAVCGLALLASGCATVMPPYRPATLSLPPLASPMAAVAQLSAAVGEHGWRDHLQVTRPDGTSYACHFRDTPDPQMTEVYNGMNGWLEASFTVQCDNGLRYTNNWNGGKMYVATDRLIDKGKGITRLWYQLAQIPAVSADAFEMQAKAYRDAATKPPLPEAAREFKVRAEAAVAEKRFLDAVEAYDRGLQLAPWWPQGHFNVALVLAELKTYGLAVEEMQRYLALVPDAANARQAQDRIYEWKGKLERPY